MATPDHIKLARKSALFKRFFDTPDGLEILAEMKAFCFIEASTVHMSDISPNKTGHLDPYATIYNEGKRVVMLHVMKLAGLTYHDIERVKSIDERERQKDMEYEAFNDD